MGFFQQIDREDKLCWSPSISRIWLLEHLRLSIKVKMMTCCRRSSLIGRGCVQWALIGWHYSTGGAALSSRLDSYIFLLILMSCDLPHQMLYYYNYKLYHYIRINIPVMLCFVFISWVALPDALVGILCLSQHLPMFIALEQKLGLYRTLAHD